MQFTIFRGTCKACPWWQSSQCEAPGLLCGIIYTLRVDAEIIAIGSELLTPFRQDTNSLYVTKRLNQLGVEVIFKTIVGDSREHLTGAACLALSRADIVIFMGGLGPTEDDLT